MPSKFDALFHTSCCCKAMDQPDGKPDAPMNRSNVGGWKPVKEWDELVRYGPRTRHGRTKIEARNHTLQLIKSMNRCCERRDHANQWTAQAADPTRQRVEPTLEDGNRSKKRTN
mmetsp:Transcript_6987/g.14660  ORF Transcript_6987/g.14660 Transcript_6987/m.14660 type:complete len:114 (-) Transcript_6987:267-608(-)